MTKPRRIPSPNYASLPILVFDLGERQLVLPAPEQGEGYVPVEFEKARVNLEEPEWTTVNEATQEKCLVLMRSQASEIYDADSPQWLGNLRIGLAIMDNWGGTFDFLDPSSLKQWIIRRAAEFYGLWNEEIRADHLAAGNERHEDYLFVYPKSTDDILLVEANSIKWLAVQTGAERGGSEMAFSFHTPLNQNLCLSVEFGWSAPPETYAAFKAEVDDLQLEYLHQIRLIPCA